MARLTPLRIALLEDERTQRSLAQAIGKSQSVVSNIVNGMHCDKAMREAIAAEMGRDAAVLWPEPANSTAASDHTSTNAAQGQRHPTPKAA